MHIPPTHHSQQDFFESATSGAKGVLSGHAKLRGQKWLILSIYVGMILQLFNQRIGWSDEGGPNLLVFLLRSDIWFTLTAIVALFSLPHPKINGLQEKILFKSPVILAVVIIISSAINWFLHNFFLDYFGLFDFFKLFIATFLGLTVYRLAINQVNVYESFVGILLWTSMINVFVALLFLVTDINNIPGFNDVTDYGDGGAGFVGLGGRFQGVGSNANIPAVEACIALGILIPNLIGKGASLPRKIFLSIYGLALGMLIIWTGVRAAVLSFFVMLAVFIWLNFRLTKSGLLRIFGTIVLIISSIGVVLALIPAELDIFGTRLDSEDGRLTLWAYYGSLLLWNPLGFGLGFTSIVDTNIGPQGMSLPPHNAILQAGMYAGYIGVGITLYLIFKILGVITITKKNITGSYPSAFIGLVLAWCSLVTNKMFAGFLSADYSFSILTALVLAGACRVPLKSKVIHAMGCK
jgi:hypothetical protein